MLRPSAVAGMFYPAEPAELTQQIGDFLDSVDSGNIHPKALIVPHAGYIYSGKVAAAAFKSLGSVRDRIKRVVLMGPAHRVYLQGCALADAHAFATPLGEIAIDHDLDTKLLELDGVMMSDMAHKEEHCLEVQLPFLQLCLPEFRLLPVVVGDAAPETVAAMLEHLWGQDDTLIVISTDLSHYLSYSDARRTDTLTCEQIRAASSHLVSEQACGSHALNGLLRLAGRKQMQIHQFSYCNSGDTAGDKDRVVGYASFALY